MKDVMTYDEAHYFDIGTASSPDVELGGVITQLDENSNPTESEKQYIHQKTKTTKVTGKGQIYFLNKLVESRGVANGISWSQKAYGEPL